MDTSFSLQVLGLVVASYVLFSIGNRIYVWRDHAAKKRAWKCEAPAEQVNRLPFGYDQVRRALAADKAKTFPQDLVARRQESGGATYSMNIMGSYSLATCDPKNIQAMLATQFHDFALGPRRRGILMPLLGNGIFTQDGKGWERSRHMMRPQFSREQVSDLELEENHVQNLMRAVPAEAPAPGSAERWTDVVDLQVLFFRLTLDSATEFLFGESVDSQVLALSPAALDAASPDDHVKNENVFARAFDQAQLAAATRFRFMDMYWLYNPASFRKDCTDCHNFIDHFVRKALRNGGKAKAAPGLDAPAPAADLEKQKPKKERYVFLDALAAETQDPIELRSQLLNILLAGRDTTASLLGWLFLMLAQHPRYYAKLRAAVLETFGPYDGIQGGHMRGDDAPITFAKLKGCTFLSQCIDETLRLFPVVPGNARVAVRDTTLPRGGGKDGMAKVFVPKGVYVDYSVYVMQREKSLWGEDADEFRPERWEGRKTGWEFLPFNGGPRICIGQQFALTEAAYVTVRLLQRFDRIERHNTESEPLHNLTLTTCSAAGVKVRLREDAAVRGGKA